MSDSPHGKAEGLLTDSDCRITKNPVIFLAGSGALFKDCFAVGRGAASE
jgi:hypothetical protein